MPVFAVPAVTGPVNAAGPAARAPSTYSRMLAPSQVAAMWCQPVTGTGAAKTVTADVPLPRFPFGCSVSRYSWNPALSTSVWLSARIRELLTVRSAR